MFRKSKIHCVGLIFLISFVLVLGLVLPSVANAADPNLMGWWRFDGDALDSSGNGRHGTFHGNPQYVAGVYNEALEFYGTPDYVTIDGYKGVLGTHAFSIAAWVQTTNTATQQIIHWGTHSDGQRLEFRIQGNMLRASHGGGNARGNTDLTDGQWHHVAAVLPDNCIIDDVTFYVDGRNDTEARSDADMWNIVANPTLDLTIGWRPTQQDRPFIGSVDDVTIYNKVLTPEEVVQIMNGEILPVSAQASNPNPAGEATDVLRDVTLTWTPGEYAPAVNGHKVYLSESFDDVNEGVGGITQDANSYTPTQRLYFDKTYYWRVDEANSVSGWDQGEVWQFTVEPFSLPIEDVNATASSSNSAGEGPENTINGSGLDANDLHSDDSKAMWLSSVIDPNAAWIQYEFDRVYKLHQMLVWNHNTTTEPVIGFGVKEAAIEYSTDGANWTTLGTHEFAQAIGTAGYAPNTTVDLGGAVAKYVKITANSNWGGFVPQFGLSEVRFLYIPVLAREPNPASGSTDMDVDNVALSWRAGREAASHEVYFSDSNQAVIDGNAPVVSVSEASYDTGELELAQTYYWKVNEVNEAGTPITWQGDVSNFTTREFLIVDDFEDYNDFEPDRIFDTWIDGWADPTKGGSQVGYAVSPFAEQTIVHSGNQSMPLIYDNSTANHSEATANIADLPISQDWTKYGITALSLYFYGDPCNVAQQMYVKLNGSKVAYNSDADNVTRIGWQPWNIDLADFAGVDLSNVTELSIGLESIGFVGGKGVVYFDDISLYPYSRELITPAEPDTANLVANYEFEGAANDSSGNGRNGTAVGDPAFVAGKVGQAISLDGIGDYVEITGYKGILGPNAVTVTAWIKTTATETGTIVNWGTQLGSQRMEFRVNADRLRVEHGDGNVQGDSNVNDGSWHHVAVTVQENATISYPEVILYLDGIDDTRPSTDPNAFNVTANVDVSIGYRATNNDRFFMGQIDDVRIYGRVLTQEEISWLAGRAKPFDKPF